MSRQQLEFLFLNLGHFLDHLMMLIFASVAALTLAEQWHMSYAELVPYATPGFVAFGLCALPAGWIADRWSRPGMIAVFFVGIGVCAILTSFANTPLQIGAGLFAIGIFAAIYHPVGLSLVVQGRKRTGIPLAINGVFGNLGVASAALLTGYTIDLIGWREAFLIPGVISILLGLTYTFWVLPGRVSTTSTAPKPGQSTNDKPNPSERRDLIRIFVIVLITTAIGGLIFQSTTFALPKIFSERLPELAATAGQVGFYAFLVFSLAAIAQLVVGYMLDNHSLRTVFVVIAATQAALFLAMVNADGVVALLLSFAFMLVVFGQIPINDVLIGRISKGAWRSRAFAVRYIVTFSVMASAVPFIAWIHHTRGFAALFLVLAGAAALILFCVTSLPGRNRHIAPQL